MTIINVADFESRAALEHHVIAVAGEASQKAQFVIKGTRAQLGAFRLSDKTVVYGVRCEVTDPLPKAEATEKPNRGEVFDSGINGQTVGKRSVKKPAKKLKGKKKK